MAIKATAISGSLKKKQANSSKPESKVVAAVMQWARDNNVYAVRVVQAGAAGVPDILLCANGKFIGVECKAAGKKPRPIQELHGEKIRQAKGLFVWGDETEIIPYLNGFLNLRKMADEE